MAKRPQDREAEAEKARRDVERMSEQEEKLLGPAERARPGEVNYDPSTDPNDPIEIWGKRIGRSLGFIFAAYLIYHLLTTYVFK
ncbi:MAG: hypothetical protein ACR2OR_16000 [Hyphomicrobiales bacterium]